MKLYIIKIGGNVIDDEKQLSSFLNDFASVSENKILVHGGGKIATELSKQLGIEAKMVDGRRITDADTLKVVQMVYGGLINKNIVAQLQSRSCNSIGLTGADANIILATKRAVSPPLEGVGGGAVDFGFVGDIKSVETQHLASLLKAGFTPIIAPLTHDGKGQILNTNADTMASAISVAMATSPPTLLLGERGANIEVYLIYCFEKSGVLKNVDDDNSIIERMNFSEYQTYKNQGIISKGMIPKLDNSFDAIKQGVKSVIICHAKDLKMVAAGQKAGTYLNYY